MEADNLIGIRNTQDREIITKYARQWIVDALNKYRGELQQEFIQKRRIAHETHKSS